METVYEFLRWDDIVREHWPRGAIRLWCDILFATWVYVRSGVTRAAFGTSFPIGVTMCVPALLILGQLLLIALCGILFMVVLAPAFGLPAWAGAASHGGRRRADSPRSAAGWTQNSTRTGADGSWPSRSATPAARWPDFDERREAFARHLIAAVETGDADEILLVGHSLGTPLAVSVMARARESQPDLGRESRPSRC